MNEYLIALVILVALGSLLLSPVARTADTFYRGLSTAGTTPTLLTLIFSQVTTWIFARSLLNAAILGFYYGIAGTIAYAAYYLSFLTGAIVIDQIRFRHGYTSIQNFLKDQFGTTGPSLYNIVVALRLASEVFANFLVVGVIFGVAGSAAYIGSIFAIAGIVLLYSMLGGLNASLRTDVFQMALFLFALIVLTAVAIFQPNFAASSIILSSPDLEGPGWVLLVVALMQIWSYPVHDPVMMDRGFIADRKTTALSFVYASGLGIACIIAFGLLGVYAGLNKLEGEAMMPTLTRLLGVWPIMLLNATLIISALSTLDSTLSSAAKLTIIDMELAKPSLTNGRIAMAAFMILGLAFVFLGSKDLFTAVAVSGVASLFLAPVVFFNVMGRLAVPVWSYAGAFALSVFAAALYFTETAGYSHIVGMYTGLEHKYSKLLVLTSAVLLTSCVLFAAGAFHQALKKRPRLETSG